MSVHSREPSLATAVTESRPRGGERLASLDNLRVVMVAGVVAVHAIAGYAGMNWTYADVAEGEMGDVATAVMAVLILPFAMYVMALFFLVAGMLTPASLDRKGPARFARDRLVRLGIPLAAFSLLLWPLMTYGLYAAAGSDWGLWDVYRDDPILDNGPLWFVEVLLVFSLAYAGWTAWTGRRRRPRPADGPLRPRHLAVVAAIIAVATFVVRLRFPFDSLQFTNAHLWQWPECAGLFALGIVSARRGWLAPVPDRIRRGCGFLAVVAIGVLLAGFLSTGSPDRALELYSGGWGWHPALMAVVAGVVSVTASVWTLAFAQRHWTRTGPLLGAASRAAYAAFMLQGVPLLLFALALRPLGVPLELKALALSATAIPGSFGLGWVLVTRTSLGRIM